MKKYLSLLVAALMLFGMMGMSVSATRGYVYHVPFMTPVVDGVAEDAWTVAEWTDIDLNYADVEPSVCTARARIMHDDNFIYFLVEITDATTGSDQDLLEFYLDEKNEKDAYSETCYQLRLGIDSVDNILEGSSNTEPHADYVTAYAIGSIPDGYLLEFAVKTDVALTAGTTMGLEFMYNDCDETGAFIGARRWNVDTANGDAAPWQSAECWGEIVMDAYVEPVVEETPADAPAAEAGEAGEAAAPAPVAPATADAGIVVAAVVMAAAAAVVVSKKH